MKSKLSIFGTILLMLSLFVACAPERFQPTNFSQTTSRPTEIPRPVGTARPSVTPRPTTVPGPTRPPASNSSAVDNLNCADQAQEFLAASRDITQRWLPARAAAEYTSREALSGPISELRQLRNELSRVQTPQCASNAKMALDRHMALVIDGYMLFMEGSQKSVVDARFEEASTWMTNYTKALQTILR